MKYNLFIEVEKGEVRFNTKESKENEGKEIVEIGENRKLLKYHHFSK